MSHILCCFTKRMCNVNKTCAQGWAKAVPEGCPQSEPITDTETNVLFHLVATDPPTEEDFQSQRELHPDRHFQGVTECVARSLSNWTDFSKCNDLRKIGRHKKKLVGRIQLAPNSGAISTRPDGHVSWWPCKGFDPVSATEVVRK